jgi:predicted nucleic acid-binding protein
VKKQLLLDTNIVIDLLRGRAPAKQWILNSRTELLLSTASVAELYAGVHNQQQKNQVERLIPSLTLVGISAEVAKQAGLYKGRYFKSHGTDIIDAIIAATAELHSLQLVTMNTKHFPMFPKLKRPYEYPA